MTNTPQEPIDDMPLRAGVLDDREEWAISDEEYKKLLEEPEKDE